MKLPKDHGIYITDELKKIINSTVFDSDDPGVRCTGCHGEKYENYNRNNKFDYRLSVDGNGITISKYYHCECTGQWIEHHMYRYDKNGELTHEKEFDSAIFTWFLPELQMEYRLRNKE